MPAVGVPVMADSSHGVLDVSVHKQFGNFTIEASFQLGSPWTILFGPSGAGKTSLLRLVAGLAIPDAGRIMLEGRTLTDCEARVFLPAGARGIGMVMQEPWLFPHLDVTSNVAFGLSNLDQKLKLERVGEVLKLCEAEDLALRMPARMSGGEKQRVALARALAGSPRVLLLDEPFSAMDGLLKELIVSRLIPWFREHEICALYVSHDLAEAYQTGADAIVMREGKVCAQGPVETVLLEDRLRLLRQLSEPSAIQKVKAAL